MMMDYCNGGMTVERPLRRSLRPLKTGCEHPHDASEEISTLSEGESTAAHRASLCIIKAARYEYVLASPPCARGHTEDINVEDDRDDDASVGRSRGSIAAGPNSGIEVRLSYAA